MDLFELRFPRFFLSDFGERFLVGPEASFYGGVVHFFRNASDLSQTPDFLPTHAKGLCRAADAFIVRLTTARPCALHSLILLFEYPFPLLQHFRFVSRLELGAMQIFRYGPELGIRFAVDNKAAHFLAAKAFRRLNTMVAGYKFVYALFDLANRRWSLQTNFLNRIFDCTELFLIDWAVLANPDSFQRNFVDFHSSAPSLEVELIKSQPPGRP